MNAGERERLREIGKKLWGEKERSRERESERDRLSGIEGEREM